MDGLLSQAAAFRQATEIRAYVEAVQLANKTDPNPKTDEELTIWVKWALIMIGLLLWLASATRERKVISCMPQFSGLS